MQKMTITKLLTTTTPNNRLDAQVLLAVVLKRPQSFVYAYPEYVLTSSELTAFQDVWKRRCDGEPLAYILGKKEFWGLEFVVNQHTLIPRPETEVLVEYVLTTFRQPTCSLLDIGTGSGAIACAIASERPEWQITAADISSETLMVAKQNCEALQLPNITCQLSDLFSVFQGQQFDIIVSNPPYIDPIDPHLQDLKFEPQQALVAADHGLKILNTILQQASGYLKPGGYVIMEHGFNQAESLQVFCKTTDLTWVETRDDYANLPRVSIFNV